MKLRNNQSGIAHLVALLIIVIIAVVGFAGWRVYTLDQENKKLNKTANTQIPTPGRSDDESVVTLPKSTIPEGFIAYENKELGFKFAYPKTWGEVKEDSNSDVIFSAHFSNLKKDDDNPVAGKNVTLYANSGKQDFSVGGRGGALWDCIGYTKSASRYFCQNIAKRAEGITNTGTEIKNPEIIKAVNTDVIAYTYSFFADDMFNITTNLKKDYYAFVLVTLDSNQEIKKQLKQVAATAEVF